MNELYILFGRLTTDHFAWQNSQNNWLLRLNFVLAESADNCLKILGKKFVICFVI